ncbi:MAG: hypothetical protein ACOCTI_08070 [Phycisphaeraceae bacterium]
MKRQDRLLRCLLAAGLTLGAAGAGRAQTEASADGQLRWMTQTPGGVEPLRADWIREDDEARYETASGEPGLVAAKATLVRVRDRFVMAIDADSPEAEWPEVIRFDFTGEGNFADAPSLPLRLNKHNRGFVARFEGNVEVPRDGQTQTVRVSGYYYLVNDEHYLRLGLRSAAGATVEIGGEPHQVVLLDGDNDLDVTTVPQREDHPDGSLRHMTRGDTVLVYPDPQDLGQAVVKGYWGQPVQVGGRWYDLSLDEASRTVSAEPVELKLGTVEVDYPEWELVLVGREHIMVLRSQDGSEQEVPADEYSVLQYELSAGEPVAGHRGQIAAHGWNVNPGTTQYAVNPGEATQVGLGEPLTVKVKSEKWGADRLNLTLAVTDVNGADVDPPMLPGRQRPAAPRFEVADAEGQTVYSGQFEYG